MISTMIHHGGYRLNRLVPQLLQQFTREAAGAGGSLIAEQ